MMRRILKKLFQKPYTPAPGQLPPAWRAYAAYIDIHPTAIIAPSATIAFHALPKRPVKMLKIGAGSHVFGHFALLCPDAKIEIGADCQIGASHFIAAESIMVGDDTLAAWGITFMDNDSHALDWAHRQNDVKQCYQAYLKNNNAMLADKDWSNVKTAPISIGKKSWIGFNAIILKGVKLADETIIGAGSVVTKSYDTQGQRLAGNPAKVIGNA